MLVAPIPGAIGYEPGSRRNVFYSNFFPLVNVPKYFIEHFFFARKCFLPTEPPILSSQDWAYLQSPNVSFFLFKDDTLHLVDTV
jgi:hypothetical protein